MNESVSLLYIIAMELNLANTIGMLSLPHRVAEDEEWMKMLNDMAKQIQDEIENYKKPNGGANVNDE